MMISLECNHPDLPRFIDIKNDLNKVTKANISVRIRDAFMKAVEEEREAEEMESLEAQEYSSDESVGTSLGDLFKNLKF